jgi:trans-2,3-dihydro-3-hydroxyanthranilate isomerase
MTSLNYLHLDVFTARRFEGNQLAVFLDGRGLDERAMQMIAREMNVPPARRAP